jgi:hypothetical protein
MKKGIIIAVLALVIGGGLFAQEDGTQNTILGGLGVGFFSAIQFSYEREFIPYFGLGVEFGLEFYAWIPIFSTFYITAQPRWYPFGGRFYLDGEVGYAQFFSIIPTLKAGPGLGWKFDFGEPGGFTLDLNIGADWFIPLGINEVGTEVSDALSESGMNLINIRAIIGFGYSF